MSKFRHRAIAIHSERRQRRPFTLCLGFEAVQTGIAALVIMLAAPATPLLAATITVTTTSMTIGVAGKSCTDAANDIVISDLASQLADVSLPEAICAANGTPGDDVIELQSGAIYTITNPHNWWYGPTALPAISSSIVIEGNGAVIERSGPNKMRLFYVAGSIHRVIVGQPPTPGDLTLRNLTLRDGIAQGGGSGTGGGGAGLGGAIYTQGQLTLDRVTATNNRAFGGHTDQGAGTGGGGIGGNGSLNAGGGFREPHDGFGADFLGGEGSGRAFGSVSAIGGNGTNQCATGDPGGGGGGGFTESAGPANCVDPAQPGDGGGAGGLRSVGGGAAFGGGGWESGGAGVGGGGGDSSDGGFGGGGGHQRASGGFGGGGGTGHVSGGRGGFGAGGGSQGIGGLYGGNGAMIGGSNVNGGGGAGLGGVVFSHFGDVRVTNSTLHDNTAAGGLGGRGTGEVGGGGGAGLGGAIFNLNGTVIIESSTLAGNVASGSAGGDGAQSGMGLGSSVFQHFQDNGVGNSVPDVTTTAAATTLTIENSIIADGTVFPGAPVDCFVGEGTTVVLLGSNLIESNAIGVNACGAPTLAADPQLSALADNGGPTHTMSIDVTSPAFDAGGICSAPTTDQRALPRPQGAACDLGAFEIQEATLDRDFGDAADPAYPTILASDGARHLVSPLYFGSCVDAEPDALASGDAMGDDTDSGTPVSGSCAIAGDDEDGVVFGSVLIPGSTTQSVTVTSSAAGLLDGWIDFNNDGDWSDVGEQVFAATSLAAGSNALTFTTPASAVPGTSIARFRLSESGGLMPNGFVANGEVEDLQVTVVPPIQISVDNVTLAEGDAGSTSFEFTIAVSSTAIPSQVVVATADGSATSPSDFSAVGATVVSFPAGGATTQTFAISVVGDLDLESDEQFSVVLSHPSPGSTVVTPIGVGTILNDDSEIALSGTPTEAEGDLGTTTFEFVLTRSGNIASTASVDFEVSGSGANPADGNDFQGAVLPTGTVTFASGASNRTLTVPIAGDLGLEPDESFTVTLVNPTGATLATATATGTIVNDDSELDISGSPSLAEGDSGSTAFEFAVNRSGDTSVAATVDFEVSGSGTNPAEASDFSVSGFPQGTVSFAAGESTHTVTVLVQGDDIVEAAESFSITLANPSATTLSTATTSGIIVNDDSAEILLSPPASQAEGETGTTTQHFDVTVSAGIEGGFELPFSTNDQTATTADNDYLEHHDSLHFAGAAAETQSISVDIVGDSVVEGDESFELVLGALTGIDPAIDPADISIDPVSVSATILNDDQATLSLLPVEPHVVEGDAGTTTLTFEAVLSGIVDGGFELAFATSDGTATTADNDYLDTTGSLVFVGMDAETHLISVDVVGDSVVEGDESFELVLGAISGLDPAIDPATIAVDSKAEVATILNDDNAAVTLVPIVDEAAEGDSGTSLRTFAATLDAGVQGGFEVAFATSDGTATTADNDYLDTHGAVLFAGSASESQEISVAVNGDTVVEDDETFELALGVLTGLDPAIDPSSVSVDTAPVLGSIIDDDGGLYGAHLEAIKTVAGAPLVGSTIRYEITVTNLGPGPQADNPGPELIDELPAEVALVDAFADRGTVEVDIEGNSVSWNGALGADQTVLIVIEAEVLGTALGVEVSNQAVLGFDTVNDGINESSALSDDPTGNGAADATTFVGLALVDIPTIDTLGMFIFAVALGIAARRYLRRERRSAPLPN